MKIGIYISIILFSITANFSYAEEISGIVYSMQTAEPLAFVSIGIPGKNVGTVSDEEGNYTLDLPETCNKDSVVFLFLGFQDKQVEVGELKIRACKSIFLTKKSLEIEEVKVNSKGFTYQVLGVETKSKAVSAGFDTLALGYECGLLIKNKRKAFLEELTVNVAWCTYDSVFYRINIYQVPEKEHFVNMLKEPIYIRMDASDIDEIKIDLTPYVLCPEGRFLVTLESVKNLGEGGMYICANLLGKSYYRKTSQGEWKSLPIGLSMNVKAKVQNK